MFDDFDEAMAADGRERRRYCGFGRWIATLEPEHAAKARELVDNRDWNCRQLARYFATKGAKFNDQVIFRHRNARCCGQ
jgi:hypothetical protein